MVSSTSFQVVIKGDDPAPVGLFRTGVLESEKLITNVQGDLDLVPLNMSVCLQVFTNPIPVDIVANPNLGDINGDGNVDLLDVDSFIAQVLSSDYNIAADINKAQ